MCTFYVIICGLRYSHILMSCTCNYSMFCTCIRSGTPHNVVHFLVIKMRTVYSVYGNITTLYCTGRLYCFYTHTDSNIGTHPSTFSHGYDLIPSHLCICTVQHHPHRRNTRADSLHCWCHTGGELYSRQPMMLFWATGDHDSIVTPSVAKTHQTTYSYQVHSI